MNVRRSLALSFAGRYATVGLAIVSNMLIARLLSPKEIGLYSVTLAIVGLAQILRDFGIGSYPVQEKSLTAEHIRTAYGVSFIAGAALFAIFIIGAPAIASFYHDAAVSQTVRITAINFLLLPFGSISMSLLRREMDFSRIIVVNVAAAIAAFIVTITLAIAGLGPNALALGSVASNVATGTLATWVRPNLKVLFPSLVEWRSVLRFGSQSTVANVLTSASMEIND